MRLPLLLALTALSLPAAASAADYPKPAALTVTNVPVVPAELASAVRPYMEFRTAGFAGWNAADRSMLIATRFGDAPQLHRVAKPMGARQQLTFEAEPLSGKWSPRGDALIVQKDSGGDEFFQLYRYDAGRLTLLTAGGKSRNELSGWSHDGAMIGFTSTERNGTDTDLYIMDPRKPASKRRLAEVKGGGWGFADVDTKRGRALVFNGISVEKSDLYLVDTTSGAMTPVGDHSQKVAFGGAQFAPDGTIWATSDAGSDKIRLGRLDAKTGRLTPIKGLPDWDVDSFDISDDGKTIAIVTNEAGSSRLRFLDVASGKLRVAAALPAGVMSGIEFAPWGELGFSLSHAGSPSDAYSINPATLKLTRWTASETGGLDPARNVKPTLVEVASFDGEKVSGFLYRPDPAKFPGKRPLIVNIHGGPEGQSTPGFRGATNYLLNELGIAVFYPNVRGSTGYGKRFVSLDNGPFLRENSVKDIGAFLDHFDKDAGLDKARFAVTGGSYGGYMCYATSIHYAGRFKGAICNVAISNFVTFLENTQSYRRDLRRVEYGDERIPEQRAKLEEISPLRRISEIKAPIFIVQGANDPRVPKSEADQIVAALTAQGNQVWYMVGENEGHGFNKKENGDYLFFSTLNFWKSTLLK